MSPILLSHDGRIGSAGTGTDLPVVTDRAGWPVTPVLAVRGVARRAERACRIGFTPLHRRLRHGIAS